jgi:hypothetical protein
LLRSSSRVIGAALAVHLGQLLRPCLGLLLGVSAHGPAFLFYEFFEAGSQAIGVFQETRDEVPHRIFKLVGTRPVGVGASVCAVPVALGAAIVAVGVAASVLGLRTVIGAHGASALTAVGYPARELIADVHAPYGLAELSRICLSLKGFGGCSTKLVSANCPGSSRNTIPIEKSRYTNGKVSGKMAA